MIEQSTWVNGKRKVTGCWSYRWSSDSFFITRDNPAFDPEGNSEIAGEALREL